MKKLFKSIVLCLTLFLVIPVSTNSNLVTNVEAATIKLNATSKTIYVKKSFTLKVSGTKKKATYKSSNKKVATVSSKGVVKAVKKGTSTITVKVNGKTLKCKITVKNPTLNKTSLSLNKGKTYTLKVSNGVGTVKWSTSNKSVATVTNKGKVTAVKSGTATISAKVSGITLKCTVKVKGSTTGNDLALQSAKDYLSFMPFSKEGLKEQLIYEKYTESQAQYAVNNCGADWKQQALKSAKSYLSTMAFSKEGLKDQLIFEKFTESQAQYAVDKCGANWNQQAVKSAKSYLSTMTFSKDELLSQLVFEKFTESQAEYGVNNCGVSW
jgi:hypothetical protein